MNRQPIKCAEFVLFFFMASASIAQAAEPLPIAMVNVDRILKSDKPFLAKLEPLKEEAKELDGKVQLRQAELETVGGKLRGMQPGSVEAQRLQLQFVKLQTELQQFVTSERQLLQKKEAAVYLEFFRRLEVEISKHAKAHGIRLVIRQYETSFDEGQPLPEILKALNRQILYEEGLDITDEILKALQAGESNAGEK